MAFRAWQHRSKVVLIAAGLAIGTIVVLSAVLPIQDWAMAAAASLRGFGPAGMLLFGAVLILAAMAMIPTAGFSFAAGLIFGPWGLVVAWLSMMVAACLSFALARFGLARHVADWAGRQRIARAAIQIVEDEGWRMVLLIRLSGLVPFGVQNYAFGATRIGFLPFICATMVGVVPSIVIAGGVGIFGGAALDEAPYARGLALGAAILAGLLIVMLSARRIREKLAPSAKSEAA